MYIHVHTSYQVLVLAVRTMKDPMSSDLLDANVDDLGSGTSMYQVSYIHVQVQVLNPTKMRFVLVDEPV